MDVYFSIEGNMDPQETILALMIGTWSERLGLLEALSAEGRQQALAPVIEFLHEVSPERLDVFPTTIPEKEQLTRAHAELALALYAMGAWHQAVAMAEQALEEAPPGISLARGIAYHCIGAALARLREVDRAADNLDKAQQVFRSVGDRRRESHVLDSQGNLWRSRFELLEAETCFRQSLAMKAEGHDLQGQAITYGNLGEIAMLRAQFDEALDLFERDLAIAEQLGDAHGQCIALELTADALLAIDDLERAHHVATRALTASAQSPYREDRASCLRLLGRIMMEQSLAAAERSSRTAEGLACAEELLDESRIIFDSCGKGEQAHRTELLLAALWRLTARYEQAQSAAQAARLWFGDHGVPDGEALALLESAMIHDRAGDSTSRDQALVRGSELATQLGESIVRLRILGKYSTIRSGELLVDCGIVTDRADLERRIERSYRSGRGLGLELLREGRMSRDEMAALLRNKLGVEAISAEDVVRQGTRDCNGIIDRRTAKRRGAIPFMRRGGRLHVAMVDPLDYRTLTDIEIASGAVVVPWLVDEAEVDVLLQWAFGTPRIAFHTSETGFDVASRVLDRGIDLGASDIHVEPTRSGYRVRFRLDGVLHDMGTMSTSLGLQLVSRLKVLSSLDITERRRPQDGRARHAVRGQEAVLRVSVLPNLLGEKVVARILPESGVMLLGEVGLDQATADALRRLVNKQDGLVLAVGPTGSGKTSTLYATLEELDSHERSVYTVEDPVEYGVDRYSQCQVNRKVGLDFAAALRAILRQDPDVLLLGEIRDLETAEIACRMALSGSLVLSTLHAYDAPSAAVRLTDLGVPHHVARTVLSGILAQRLVRRLCPDCRIAVAPEMDLVRRFVDESVAPSILERGQFFRASGCAKCHHTGYRGRIPVYELMEATERIRACIGDRCTAAEIKTAARQGGFTPLGVQGLRCAAAGHTSLHELARVL